jgi:hypothetical protein
MCMQCMLTAMTSTAAATGTRSWLASRRWSWLTPTTLKRITVALVVLALAASAVLVGGSAHPSA